MPKKISQVDRNFRVQAPGGAGWRWHRVPSSRFEVRGLPWFDENDGAFIRLPRRGDNGRVVSMTHMTVTGQSGLMVYAGPPGQLLPLRGAYPPPDKPEYEAVVFEGFERRLRELTVYLPLYNSLRSLAVGLDRGACLRTIAPPALPKPVVFYGTSITQGGCACTPGADYISTVCRMLNLDYVNLGFSGNGRGEPEMAELVGEIDAGLFVLDYVANTSAQSLADTLPGFYRTLRTAHPETPILLLSRISFWPACHSAARLAEQEAQRDVLIRFYADTRGAGDRNLHFADGEALIRYGEDLAYVDGVHPTDHGFWLMAERLAPFLRKILFPPRA
ncbi:MAG: hypothetical protein BWZ02_01040 [Lentisphaerae bacterium ADurb.BinA184]|nr:MAG: hypothetical protein BWZ02_01040 [Lentisphaerae bacterium ADurb.BinA184]